MPHGTNEKTTLQTTVRLFFHISTIAGCLHTDMSGYMKKDSAQSCCKVVCECRRRYYTAAHFSFLPTVDSKVLRTWRTGAHRYRVADAIDFVAIAITLAMLATSPTIAGCLHTDMSGYMKKK